MRKNSIIRRIFGVIALMMIVIMLVPVPAEALSLGSNEIKFDRIMNARDLGGYRTTDGRIVKKGLLIRSGELAYASSRDISRLRNTYHIGTVIDFRYTTDHKRCPDKKIAGAKNVNIPAKYAKKPSKSAPKKRYKKMKKKSNSALRTAAISGSTKVKKSYTNALVTSSYSQKKYRQYFSYLLSNKPDKGILLHCTYGKDRTGVASFMTLVALGVDEETAYQEYALTNSYLNKYGHSKYAKGRIGVRVSDLRSAVNQMKKKYGSMERFLYKAYGLDSAKIRKLREMYTEEIPVPEEAAPEVSGDPAADGAGVTDADGTGATGADGTTDAAATEPDGSGNASGESGIVPDGQAATDGSSAGAGAGDGGGGQLAPDSGGPPEADSGGPADDPAGGTGADALPGGA